MVRPPGASPMHQLGADYQAVIRSSKSQEAAHCAPCRRRLWSNAAMRFPEGRRALDWSQILATVIGDLIAICAAFSAELWRARMDTAANQRAQSRVAHGSVRAWRDDLYEAEELLGLSIASRRWTAERDPPLANIDDYKEVSRAASWETWRHLSAVRHDLDHLRRAWREPRRLNRADVELLADLLISVERARLALARELDAGEPTPARHPIFREAGLQDLFK